MGSNREKMRSAALPAVPVLVFVAVTTFYSWMTPMWEANDEPDHVGSIQIVHSGRLPAIGDNVESAQPPLYYAVAAGWQTLLGIPSVDVAPRPDSTPVEADGLDRYLFAHDYDDAEYTAAVRVHLLRMLSVLLGALTVWLTYLVARRAGADRIAAAAVASTVAVWPKFVVISATVQNDSLATVLCTALIYVVLRWSTETETTRARTVLAASMGVLAGSAVLTKYTTLPVVGLLLLACLVRAAWGRARGRRVLELLGAGAVGVLVCGWWFVRNVRLYGDLLADEASRRFLAERVPGLVVPVPWTDQERFLEELPRALVDTTWYVGGWNQWTIPLGVSLLLTAVACAGFGGALRVALRHLGSPGWRAVRSRLLPVVAALCGGAAAVLIIARTTTQGQGRYFFTVISVVALCLVVGVRELAADSRTLRIVALWTWPALLAALNLYVAVRYVLPNDTL